MMEDSGETVKIGAYEISFDQQLGSGSYGEVYLCHHIPTGKPHAIKILNKKKIISNPYMAKAFLTEMSIMKKMNNKNIVAFTDFMESQSKYYIVMQFCEGGSLTKLMQKHKKLDQKQAIDILRQICNGFIALVRGGIIHRDLKPDNILFKDGIVKIIDFGFSKEAHNLKVLAQTPVGTPQYMSIQVHKAEAYTSKCDIWSIGIIFYEMLTGKRPWKGKTSYQLVENTVNQDLILDQTFSEKTRNFLEKSLEKQQQNRLSWGQLFQNPIFQGYFNFFKEDQLLMSNRLRVVMSQIRFLVNYFNINIPKLYIDLEITNISCLGFKQFEKLIKEIHPQIKQEELNNIFTHTCKYGKQEITIQELNSLFQEFYVNLKREESLSAIIQLAEIQFIHRIESEKNIKNLNQEQSHLKFIKIEQCFVQIYRQLLLKRKSLFQIFEKYDIHKKGFLNFQQFSSQIKEIQPNFSKQDLKEIFYCIDTDHSQTIEFDEFNDYFCKINKINPILIAPIDSYRSSEQKIKRFQKKRYSTSFEAGGSGGFILDALKKGINSEINKKLTNK